MPYNAENWHVLSHEQYFSKHRFLDTCRCAFNNKIFFKDKFLIVTLSTFPRGIDKNISSLTSLVLTSKNSNFRTFTWCNVKVLFVCKHSLKKKAEITLSLISKVFEFGQFILTQFSISIPSKNARKPKVEIEMKHWAKMDYERSTTWGYERTWLSFISLVLRDCTFNIKLQKQSPGGVL